ncbi:MAG: hypothetical protein Fur0022_08990 [Anaerolineales bacterium]
MNYGMYFSRFAQSEKTSIVSAVGVHAYQIGHAQTRYFMCCEPAALDETELVAPSTAHDRFQEWVAEGVFLKLWKAGVECFDDLKGMDWGWLSKDGAMTKAPLGGEDTGKNPTDRGKKGRTAAW